MSSKVTLQHTVCEAILSHMAEGVVATDEHGRIVFMNRMAAEMSGSDAKRVIGRPLKEVVRIVYAETRAPAEIPIEKALTGGMVTRISGRSLLVGSRGKETRIDCSCSPLQDDNGRITGASVIFRNASDLEYTDKRILAKMKLEAISSLAGGLAHDFSNLLKLITGYASSVVDNLIPNTKAHEDALKILDVAEHAESLTKRLLSLARAREANLEPLSLAEAIRNSMSLVEGTFTKQNIEIKVRNLDKMPHIIADAGQFTDALMNMLFNAADAMPEGGTVTVDAEEQVIGKPDIHLNPNAKPGRYVVLRIRDTGCGMPKSVLDRIFEPFFSTKERGAVMGLGLTVAQSAVHSWGGWVKVWSRPGKGSSFRFFVPRALHSPPAKSGEMVQLAGKTVLVADDNKAYRAQARSILRRVGCKVLLAKGGREAIFQYRKHAGKIDISVIDLLMPKCDGKDVLQAILGLDPTAPVILLSGFSREYVRSHMARGAWGFVQKPFDNDQMITALRKVMGQAIVSKKHATETPTSQ